MKVANRIVHSTAKQKVTQNRVVVRNNAVPSAKIKAAVSNTKILPRIPHTITTNAPSKIRIAPTRNIISTIDQSPAPSTKHISWVNGIDRVFAISIRPDRWNNLKRRFGPWSQYVTLWHGTNGHVLNFKSLESQKKHPPNQSYRKLRKGEIGCYDSHFRLWEHIVANRIPLTLILEDDANIVYCEQHQKFIQEVLDEAKEKFPNFDMLYLGHNARANNRKIPNTKRLAYAGGCNGLFAYLLSFEGAKKLVAKAKPFNFPVDVYTMYMHDNNDILGLAAEPRLCYVVPVESDTAHIT